MIPPRGQAESDDPVRRQHPPDRHPVRRDPSPPKPTQIMTIALTATPAAKTVTAMTMSVPAIARIGPEDLGIKY